MAVIAAAVVLALIVAGLVAFVLLRGGGEVTEVYYSSEEAVPVAPDAPIVAYGPQGLPLDDYTVTVSPKEVDWGLSWDSASRPVSGTGGFRMSDFGNLPEGVYSVTVEQGGESYELPDVEVDPSGSPDPVHVLPDPDGASSDAAGSSDEAFAEFAEELGITQYEAEYQYRYRSYEYNPFFEWMVGDGIPEGAALGSHVADLDSDGERELLVVRWTGESVDLEVYEADDSGAPNLACTLSDTLGLVDFLNGDAGLDVLVNDEGAIYVQFWYHTSPVADGHIWEVDRFDYDGETFVSGGVASVEGTDDLELYEVKAEMSSIGLDTSYVPDTSWVAPDDNFTSWMLGDVDSSLSLVTRAVAQIDEAVYAHDEWHEGEDDKWSDPVYLGEFTIGPDAVQRDDHWA